MSTETAPPEELAEAAASVEQTDRGPQRATSAADLKKRAVHRDVVLPSGAIVDIKVPNLPQMIKSGTIPNDLIDAAVQHQNVEKVTREIMEQTWDFTEFIVPLTLVSPEIAAEDVKDLSGLDVEMIANFAARRTDLDAVGHQLGGLETQKSFRDFRDLTSLREALGGP